MKCAAPAGVNNISRVSDLCWLDDITVFLAQYRGKQVLKATIHKLSQNCSFHVLDSGYQALRISCSKKEEKVYVVDPDNRRIHVYNRSGHGVEWKPRGLTGRPQTVTVNKNKIIVGNDKARLHVYRLNQEFLNSVDIDGDLSRLYYTHITKDGLFLATTRIWEGKRRDGLIIFDLANNSTVGEPCDEHEYGNFNHSSGIYAVCNEIWVSELYNYRVTAFSMYGRFLYHLRFVDDILIKPSAISISPNETLLALRTGYFPWNTLTIYNLTQPNCQE